MKNNLFLKRFAAFLIDGLVVMFVSSALSYLTFLNPKYEEYRHYSDIQSEYYEKYYEGEITATELSREVQNLNYDLTKNGYVYVIGTIVISILYYTVFVYFTNGQTLGKKIMGIRIVSNKDKKLNILNYLIRTIVLNGIIINIVSLVAIGFNRNVFAKITSIASTIDLYYMMVLAMVVVFASNGRGIQDILAGTKVVDDRLKQEEGKDNN